MWTGPVDSKCLPALATIKFTTYDMNMIKNVVVTSSIIDCIMSEIIDDMHVKGHRPQYAPVWWYQPQYAMVEYCIENVAIQS